MTKGNEEETKPKQKTKPPSKLRFLAGYLDILVQIDLAVRDNQKVDNNTKQ